MIKSGVGYQLNSRFQTMLVTCHYYWGRSVCVYKCNSKMKSVSSILILLMRAQALMTLSKLTSSGFGFLICQRRVIAKVSCRSKILIFVPKILPRVKARPEPSDLVLGFDFHWVSGDQLSGACFLQIRASLSLLKISTGAHHFLPFSPQIFNRDHIRLCWDQLIMYCCSAPVKTAAVFSIIKTAAFWQGSPECAM